MEQENMRLTALALMLVAASMAGISLGGIRKMPWRQTQRHVLALRCAVALTIGVDVGALLLFAYQTVSCNILLGKDSLWINGLFAGGCLLLSVLLFLCPVSLYPEDSGALTLTDHMRQRLTACLWRLLARFFPYGCWLVLLLCVGPLPLSPQMAGLALCIGAAAMLGLLWDGRQTVKIAYERIEALVDKQYQAELLNFMQVIRSQRHDFNFHMQTVAGMIETQHYEECDQYVRDMVRHVEQLNDILPLKDPVISALVNTFREMAAGKNIRLEVQALSQLEGLPCTMYEFNSILGNLLQNAIDETEGKPPEKRWIQLAFLKRSRRHIIKVSNPCDREPAEFGSIFDVGYSTKQSHEGIGLVTVRKLAAKYGGTVYLEHDPGVVHFIVRLPALGSELQ